MTTKIVGTGSCTPDRIVTNEELAGIVDTSDEWIRSRTGICERRISQGTGTAELAAEAARRALADAGVQPEELDLIVLATTTAECCFPSAACQVQAMIGADRAAAFDLGAACSGFLFALNTVHGFLASGMYKTALVIGADVLSKLVDWEDRSTCVLFGDGAGAAVVRASEERPEEKFCMTMGSDGGRGHVLECRSRSVGNFLTCTKPELGYMTMDGGEVFQFAVRKVPECIRGLLAAQGVETDDVKYFVLHQANHRILEAIAKRLRVPMDRIPSNMEKYGNTSAASIPLLLDELNREGKLCRGDRIVLAGFGAGLTWGAALLTW